MGILDGLKGIFNVSDDDYEDDYEETAEEEKAEKQQPPKRNESSYKQNSDRKSKTVQFNPQNMQVVLVRPERFDDVSEIADHLCNHRTVLLNLEAADRDVSRRLLDFLTGVAYAKNGKISKAANNTFVITPSGVDVSGEVAFDDYDDGRIYM